MIKRALSPLFSVCNHYNHIFPEHISFEQPPVIILKSYEDHHIIIWWSSYHHKGHKCLHSQSLFHFIGNFVWANFNYSLWKSCKTHLFLDNPYFFLESFSWLIAFDMNRWVNIFHWFHLCGHDSENQQFIRFGQHKVSCFLFGFQQDVYRWVNIYECECDVVSNWSLSNLLVGDDACAVFGLVKHWEVLKLDSIHPPCLEVLLDLLSELPVKEDIVRECVVIGKRAP